MWHSLGPRGLSYWQHWEALGRSGTGAVHLHSRCSHGGTGLKKPQVSKGTRQQLVLVGLSALGALRLGGLIHDRVGMRQEGGKDQRFYFSSPGKATGHLEPTGY